MQVKDLQPKQGKVDIVLDIVDVGEPREFEKFGKSGRVANAVAKDETGDIKLTLWNDDVDKIKSGDKVKITNGYVSEWQGEKQLGTGKFGTIEVIGESKAAKEEMTSPPDEKEDKEIYRKSEKKLQEIEEDAESSSIEEEEVGDE
ncbi:MAG: OB-fold nucleic acid binding domain-containing protein [Nanoarchaeota archaeon]